MRPLEEYRRLLAHTAWQPPNGVLPPVQARWLLHHSSLTEKLQQICDCFQVDIVHEGWIYPSYNHEKQWLREVVLKCGQTDWIFAQTLLPQTTIEQVAQAVPELGNRPIGLWLFPQQPTRLSLNWQFDTDSGLYARRSLLSLKGYPIEIKELFLTDFPFER